MKKCIHVCMYGCGQLRIINTYLFSSVNVGRNFMVCMFSDNFYYCPLNKIKVSFSVHSIKSKQAIIKINILAVWAWILRSTLGQCGFLRSHNISDQSQSTLGQWRREKENRVSRKKREYKWRDEQYVQYTRRYNKQLKTGLAKWDFKNNH